MCNICEDDGKIYGKIMIPMYRLRLHGLCGLYGPRCPLSPERPLNLITHSHPAIPRAVLDSFMPSAHRCVLGLNIDRRLSVIRA